MFLLRALRRMILSIAAFAEYRAGLRLYSRGRFGRALLCIERSLALGGPSFGAHLHLGKIQLRLGRFDRARQEFAAARRIDPGRFASHGLPEDVLLEMAERFYQPLWRHGGPALQSRARSAERADDFASAAERERFRGLPPIRREDIENVDWREADSLLE